jgi:hypothetical protein
MDMVEKTEIPSDCSLQEKWAAATYRDCFARNLSRADTVTASALFQEMMSNPPAWIGALMRLRNGIVRHLGLNTDTPNENFEDDNPASYSVGDYIGIFKVENVRPDEIIVSTNDKHLDAYFSLLISKPSGQVSFVSAVRTKEKLGDVYMFFIAPFHRLIVKYMLAKLN